MFVFGRERLEPRKARKFPSPIEEAKQQCRSRANRPWRGGRLAAPLWPHSRRRSSTPRSSPRPLPPLLPSSASLPRSRTSALASPTSVRKVLSLSHSLCLSLLYMYMYVWSMHVCIRLQLGFWWVLCVFFWKCFLGRWWFWKVDSMRLRRRTGWIRAPAGVAWGSLRLGSCKD